MKVLSQSEPFQKLKKPQKTNEFISRLENGEKLDNLLGDSIHLHQVSDVPLGIFLSGGVDSSLIAKYLSSNSHIEAFNIGSNSQWDETKYAKIAADGAGIKLNTKYIEDHDFLNYFEN